MSSDAEVASTKQLLTGKIREIVEQHMDLERGAQGKDLLTKAQVVANLAKALGELTSDPGAGGVSILSLLEKQGIKAKDD